jgi:hypothetical protein
LTPGPWRTRLHPRVGPWHRVDGPDDVVAVVRTPEDAIAIGALQDAAEAFGALDLVCEPTGRNGEHRDTEGLGGWPANECPLCRARAALKKLRGER